jgi:hypothetical protein
LGSSAHKPHQRFNQKSALEGKMKKQPQHCAHVADYYASKAELHGGGIGPYLRQFVTDNGLRIGGANAVRRSAQHFRKYVFLAAKEWIACGGAA